jgi:hypothetical protein
MGHVSAYAPTSRGLAGWLTITPDLQESQAACGPLPTLLWVQTPLAYELPQARVTYE